MLYNDKLGYLERCHNHPSYNWFILSDLINRLFLSGDYFAQFWCWEWISESAHSCFRKKPQTKNQALYIYIKVIFETSSIQVRRKKDPSARKCRFLLWLLQCHPWLGSRCRILPILHPSTSQFSTCFQLLQDYSYVSINKDCFTYFHLEKSFKLVGNL
jgi:hypothetical protein